MPNRTTANTTATAPVAKASGSPVSRVTAKTATKRMLRNSMLIATMPPGTQPRSRMRLEMPWRSRSRPADGDRRLDRPDDRIPRRARRLADLERVPGVDAAVPDQRQHVGDEEDEGEGVEPGAGARLQRFIDHVDADVAAVQQGVAAGQQVGHGREVDRRLVAPAGGPAEHRARHHLVEHREGDGDDGEAPEQPRPFVEAVDPVAEALEGAFGRAVRCVLPGSAASSLTRSARGPSARRPANRRRAWRADPSSTSLPRSCAPARGPCASPRRPSGSARCPWPSAPS